MNEHCLLGCRRRRHFPFVVVAAAAQILLKKYASSRIKGTISNWTKWNSSENRWECEESIVLSKRIDNDCRKRENNECDDVENAVCARVCAHTHTCVCVCDKVSAKLFLIFFSVLESPRKKNCWLCWTCEIKCDDENNKKRTAKQVGKRINTKWNKTVARRCE